MAIAVVGARLLLPAAAARRLPARRQRAPAAVVGRAARRRGRRGRTWPARRGSPTTRGRSAPRSAAASTCTRAADHRAADARRRLRRSSPRSTCPATGSTATSLHVGAVAHRRRRLRRRAQHARPGRRIGSDAEVEPGSLGLRAGPGRRALGRVAGRARSGAPARGWPTERPPRRPALARRLRRSPSALFSLAAGPRRRCPAGCCVAGAVSLAPTLASARPSARCSSAPLAGAVVWLGALAVLVVVVVRLLGIGLPPGTTRSAAGSAGRSGRPSG